MSSYRHLRMEWINDVLVARIVDARLSDTMWVTEFQDELLLLVDREKPKKVLVSFHGVTHCSTAVINGLLRAKKKLMTSGGGQIKLSDMHAPMREAYKLLNLDGTVFHIHDSEAEALAAFGYV